MTSTEMETMKITPEVLQELLQYYNLTRQEFIHTYNIQPLVYVPELPTGAKATFVLIYTLIFVLALMGNSLVVCVVVRKGKTQSATSIFICSLAISDLLITFFCIPFTLLQNISAQWFGGVLVCKTVPFVQTTAIVTGILTMTCIAVERYQGIVHPLKMKRQYTPKRAYRMLVCVSGLVWLVSVMVGSPMLFVQQLEVKYDFLYENHHVCCQESWSSVLQRRIYTTFIMVALFVLPLAAMLFLYTRISIELWIRKREEKACSEDDDHHRLTVHHLLGTVPHHPHALRVQQPGAEVRRGDPEHDRGRGSGHRIFKLVQQSHRVRLHEREL
ncbi:pyroglutamylated RF-amide peptide receptor isoform X5 [Trichomycterus rosablanca]|uniref:pyroglutamylated RF-amide peptide receptor isoform X5 n=1 Tax=Trichomycterus rosablanca TaxID=2290929 RepID=UPI002F351A6D